MHKVLYPNFIQEEMPVIELKSYLECLGKNIMLISNKILRVQVKLKDSNAIQIKENQWNMSI